MIEKILTATVTNPFEVPELPPFLKRNKDGSFADPTAWGPIKPLKIASVPTTEEKWRELERTRLEQKKIKATGRVRKMKAVLSDRAAVASGKHWNADAGRWE